MLVSQDWHTATLLPSGKVLVAGGNSGVATATAEIYDPATNAWSAAASMSIARFAHAATLLQSGQVLVTGGAQDGSTISASAEVYDPLANTWTSVAAMANPHAFHTASLLNNGSVLICGGDNYQTSSYIASCEVYW
jgi:N-acetylneuraminic acid mutarotase